MERSGGRRLRRLSIRSAVVLACALAAGALAHSAQASSLHGELLVTNPVPGDVTTVVCGPTSFTYHVEGIAFGQHNGRFTEDGTVVFNPILDTIVSLDATFTILASEGDVTGEKHYIGPSTLPDTADCTEIGDEFSEAITTQNLCYRAAFADGSPDETGRSGIALHGAGQLLFFTEHFELDPTVTSCGGAACPDEEDEDGDGLIDSKESRFLTLLGNDDSDFDGIADGNDDANGNGDDDEDEDDDEDDGCPDEDSDDDGEDDEDEDDDEDDDDDD